MYRFIFLAAVILAFHPAKSQSISKDTNSRSVFTIPFRITAYNNIVIKAVVNHKDTANLMLHTASSDVILTEEAVKRIQSVKFTGSVDDVQSWGGGGNASRYSANNSLGIAGLQWDKIDIWEDKNSGQETDGKFGLNLFAGKFIELDFDKNQMIISNTPAKKMKGYVQLPLTVQNDNLFITTIGKAGAREFAAKALIHSGYGGNLLLADSLVLQTGLDTLIKITGEKQLKDAYGNVIVTKKGILPSLNFGKNRLQNVPVGFFTGAIGRQKMNIIGGDLLKRFNIIIDRDRKFIYLKPNHLFKTGFSNI